MKGLLKSSGSVNFLFYLFFHGARYVFPLAITPFLAVKLGPAQFGDFVLWNSCVWASSLLMEFGFYIFAIKRVAETNGRDELQGAVSAIVTAKIMLAPLAGAAYLAAAFGLGLAAREPVATAVGMLCVLSYGGSLAWFLQGLQRAGRAVMVEGLPLILQFCLVFLLVRGPADLWIVSSLQAMAAVLTVATAFAMMMREGVRPRIDFRQGRKAIGDALPYFVERLCHTLYSTATPMLVAALSNPVQVAFFGIGDKVNTLLTGLCLPLAQAAMPIVARRVTPGQEDWSLSTRLVLGMTLFTIVLATVTSFAIGPFIHWFFKAQYDASIVVARLFCITSVFAVLQFTLANFFIIPGGRAKLLMKAGVAALAVSLCVQVAVVPYYGAVGAVAARTMAELCSAAILAFVAVNMVRRRRKAVAEAPAPAADT